MLRRWNLKPVEFFGFLIDCLKQLKPVEFENIFFVFLSLRKNLWTGLSHIFIIHWFWDPCPILADKYKLLLCITQVNMCEINQVHTSVYFQICSEFTRRERAWFEIVSIVPSFFWFVHHKGGFDLRVPIAPSLNLCIMRGSLIWETQLVY
jgi:hypothetical protein